MRISIDAVMCKSGNWYDGELDGFVFRIKEKITKKDDVTHITGHIPFTSWLYQKGINDTKNKIANCLMRNVKIFSQKNKKIPVKSVVGVGVEKLYIYTGRDDNYNYNNEVHNFLCSQCMWTCKQGKNTTIYSCKAFDSEKPGRKNE